MSTLLHIASQEVLPEPQDLLLSLGVQKGQRVRARVEQQVQLALDLFQQLATPIAVVADTKKEAFARIYAGQGRNEPATPLSEVFPRADKLALFALTVGPDLVQRIATLFSQGDFALGAFLDAAGSIGSELCVQWLERNYYDQKEPAQRALCYSPGYCGWHVSGQHALFAALSPEPHGIRLRQSSLMEPLKSVSGVLILGPRVIHRIESNYPFCRQCKTKTCHLRFQ